MDNLQVKTNSADRLWSFFGGPVARRMARWRMLFEEVEISSVQIRSQMEAMIDSCG